jgi:ribosomal protein L7/L12
MTKENKQLVDVHLVDAGKDPIQVIDTLGIIKSQPSLNEAVDLVHGPPGGLILAGVNMSEAESALNELHEAGAVAEIKPSSN